MREQCLTARKAVSRAAGASSGEAALSERVSKRALGMRSAERQSEKHVFREGTLEPPAARSNA